MLPVQNNVIDYNFNKKDNKLEHLLTSFVAMQSKNTRESYNRVIPEFFEMMYGKKLGQITADDLESTEKIDVREKYYSVMKMKGFKNSTIINYISIVRSFLSEMEGNRIFVDEHFYDYKRLREVVLDTKSLKNDTRGRELLGEIEYDLLHDWIVNGKEWSARYADRARKYQIVLEFMYVTGIRIDSVFSHIKWSDIKREYDDYGNFAYVVHALDKGEKLNEKPIADKLYEVIKYAFYNQDTKSSDLVFKGLSKRSFTDLLKEWSDTNEYGFKATPHSIRVGAATKLYKRNKDAVGVQRFLDHGSLETTMRYIRSDRNFLEMGSYILSNNVPIDILETVSYNDIVDVIIENQDLAYQVINKLKEKGKID